MLRSAQPSQFSTYPSQYIDTPILAVLQDSCVLKVSVPVHVLHHSVHSVHAWDWPESGCCTRWWAASSRRTPRPRHPPCRSSSWTARPSSARVTCHVSLVTCVQVWSGMFTILFMLDNNESVICVHFSWLSLFRCTFLLSGQLRFSVIQIVVKLREREGQGVDPGRSLKGLL